MSASTVSAAQTPKRRSPGKIVDYKSVMQSLIDDIGSGEAELPILPKSNDPVDVAAQRLALLNMINSVLEKAVPVARNAVRELLADKMPTIAGTFEVHSTQFTTVNVVAFEKASTPKINEVRLTTLLMERCKLKLDEAQQLIADASDGAGTPVLQVQLKPILKR